jgi:hypothetical protein
MSLRSRILYHWPSLLIFTIGAVVVAVLLAGFGAGKRSVHMSVFGYRDINRNGIYDVEDRPYAGLRVALSRPAGGPVEIVSNIAGFANFDMMRSRRHGHIYGPGEYTIHVDPPENWEVTSSTGVQTIAITRRDASITGLVADRTFDAVGIAPVLEIAGVVEPGVLGDRPAPSSLQAYAPDGETTAVTIAEDGAYAFPATPGTWRLELPAHRFGSLARDVTVGAYSVVASRFPVAATMHTSPRPQVRTIGFDDLTPSDTLYEIPNGYAGMHWRNWVATHQKLYGGDGYVNAAVSSEYVAYTSAGHPATLSSEQEFDFVGAYVTQAWPEGEQYDVIVRAWREGEQVYEDRFPASVAGPVWFDADYRGITKLVFVSDGYWQLAVDDLTIRTD